MDKKVLSILLCLVLLFSLSVFVFAANRQNSPVNTVTDFSQNTGCEDCNGEPLQKQFRAMTQRELLLGENGFFRRQMRQSFGS